MAKFFEFDKEMVELFPRKNGPSSEAQTVALS